MPINIYRNIESEDRRLAYLCDDDWELPSQLLVLEEWLDRACSELEPGNIVADIGFTIRAEAMGGGAVLSASVMGKFSDFGIDLYLSEYPPFLGEGKSSEQQCESGR